MKIKKYISGLLICTLFIGFNTGANVLAFENNEAENVLIDTDKIAPRATGSFTITIPANSTARENEGLPLNVGEIVRIRAVYTPSSAKVKFGLIGSDNMYHSFTASEGNVDATIEVPDTDTYYFQVHNTEDYTVRATGYVYY